MAKRYGSVWSGIFRALLLGLPGGMACAGPLVLERGPARLTTEAFVNMTAGADAGHELGAGRSDEGRLDGALRLLAQRRTSPGPEFGARLAIRTSPEDRAEISDASLLLFGKSGRLEFGDRQGLPDVLVGYAPNNFTFVSAEFGPASGPSLDPGGGLQLAFVGRELAERLRPLSSLGFTASLADDESTKLLYVSPKYRGFTAGMSFAPEADDPRYADLVQAGLTHDSYWANNSLHVGGSYSFAKGAASVANLNSVNVGVTLTLEYDLQLGLSLTYDHADGHAIGSVGSINYNRGPWTVGGYLQWAAADVNDPAAGTDEMRAVEAGISYRTSTRLRFYGAYYYVDFSPGNGSALPDGERGGLFLAGIRLSL